MQQIVRERLIRTAALHFADAGFDAARIDAISQDAGLAKGTVYNYFASKQELFGVVVEEAARRAAGLFRLSDQGGSVRSRLVAVAEADVAVLREGEAFVKVLVREAMSFRAETYQLIQEHLAPYVNAVAGLLEEGVNQGEIRDDTPVEQLALLFVGTLSMLYVQHWGSNGAWPSLEEIPALTVTTFLDGAARKRSPDDST
jgi:TetR/AcrR family transcriptional regulator, fatty acid metabolism regulator protein